MNMEKNPMIFSLVAIASVLIFVATVSAGPLASNVEVEVEGIDPYSNTVAVTAGERVLIEVEFDALEDDTEVTVEAELEGEKIDVDAITTPFVVEQGTRHTKLLILTVPYELKDNVSDTLDLNIEIDGEDHKTELAQVSLRVQRPSYNADIKSISVSQTAEAGENLPVDIVLKNRGYNDLDDLFVTATIVELGVEKTAYFGDLVAIEVDSDDDDDDKDTVSGRIYLEVPFDAEAGVYTVEVAVSNEDTDGTAMKQIVIENDFANSVIATSSSKTVAAGESAVYDLLIVNPTDKLRVYRVVTESSADIASSTESAVVAIPAGSSKAVKVSATANTDGAYNFNVNIFSGENVAETVTLTLNVQGKSASNPVVLLTVILAIVFLVLLVVLVVLLGKKPSNSEEFGESYY